jgi:hypothetical protein
MTYCNLVQVEQFSPGDCAPAVIVQWLCEIGRAGRFLHYVENHHPRQWDLCCALEEALIEAKVNDGWEIVVGRIDGDGESQGWLASDGWVILPYGPERAQYGSDLGIWAEDEFLFLGGVWARTPAADESGIELNRELLAGFFIDQPLGS